MVVSWTWGVYPVGKDQASNFYSHSQMTILNSFSKCQYPVMFVLTKCGKESEKSNVWVRVTSYKRLHYDWFIPALLRVCAVTASWIKWFLSLLEKSQAVQQTLKKRYLVYIILIRFLDAHHSVMCVGGSVNYKVKVSRRATLLKHISDRTTERILLLFYTELERCLVIVPIMTQQ